MVLVRVPVPLLVRPVVPVMLFDAKLAQQFAQLLFFRHPAQTLGRNQLIEQNRALYQLLHNPLTGLGND